MDKLERMLRESSETPRKLDPPAGQWEAIKNRLAVGTGGATEVPGAAGGINWLSAGLIGAGLGLLGLTIWWFAAPVETEEPSTQRVETQQVVADREEPEVSLDEQQADLGLGRPEAEANPEKDERSVRLEQHLGIGSEPGEQPREEVSSFDLPTGDLVDRSSSFPAESPDGTPVEEVSEDPILPVQINEPTHDTGSSTTIRLVATEEVESPGLRELPTMLRMPASLANPQVSDQLSGSGYSYAQEIDGWRSIRRSQNRWEAYLNVLTLPVGSISSYVNEYSSTPIEGATAETFEFDGEEIDLFRVNNSEFYLPGRNSWFVTLSAGISRRFKSGFRVGFGLSYYDASLLRRAGSREDFPGADETFFVRERLYDSEILIGRLELEYLIWRRKRFRVAVGASIASALYTRDIYRNQLFQPATETRENLDNENTLFINNSVDETLVILPQIDFEYQLSRRLSLSLGLGTRLGIGARYWVGGGAK